MQNGASEQIDNETIENVTQPLVNGYSEHGSQVETDAAEQNVDPKRSQPVDGDVNIDSGDNNRGQKRKFTEVGDSKRFRAPSPPWKKIEAEGPTSFSENGRRKSGRTNLVPLELQPQSTKRQTRAALQRSHERIHHPTKPRLSQAKASGHEPFANRFPSQGKPSTDVRVSTSHGYHARRSLTSKEASYRDRPNGTSHDHGRSADSPRSRRSHVRSSNSPEIRKLDKNTRSDRSSRKRSPDGRETQQTQSISPSLDRSPVQIKRLRLHFRPPPLAILSPGNLIPPRKYSSFKEALDHDDPLEGEELGRYTKAEATEKAAALNHIEDAARPGGIFSQDRWSQNEVEPPPDPAAYYTHPDYLLKHVVNFRSELEKEKRFHRSNARKLAHACLERWKAIQPKTEEDLLIEVQKRTELLYREIVKKIKASWALVEEEVRKEKLQEYHEEQMARGKQAMGQFVEHSGRLMMMRRTRHSTTEHQEDTDGDGSSVNLGTDEEHGSSESGSGEDSEITSSSTESEDEGDSDSAYGDDELSAEQLRLKYATILENDQESVDENVEAEAPVQESTGREDTNDGVRKLELMVYSSPQPDDTSMDVANDDYLSEPYEQSISRNLYIDPSQHPLDEVDANLLDDDDDDDEDDDSDSSEVSDESGTINSDSDSKAESDSNEESDNDLSAQAGLMGFFSKKQLNSIKAETTKHNENSDIHAAKGVDAIHGLEQDQLTSDLAAQHSSDGLGAQDSDANFARPDARAAEHSIDEGNLAPDELSPRIQVLHDDQDPSAIGESSMESPSENTNVQTEIPSLLRGQLRKYQHEGLDWLAGLYDCDTNGILADEMGLGKTIQTIALLAYLAVERHIWGPHLVVVPTSVMLNWEMEFKKWCPGFKILTYYGNQEERKMKRKGWMDNDRWHVCITSYQLALQDASSLKRRDWHYLILDEAHNIKNFRSQRWQTLLSFKSQARLLLTGTPLQNNLTELWSLLFFLNPELDEEGNLKFGDLSTFSRAFNRPVDQIMDQGRDILDEDSKKIVSKLHSVLRPHLLRRLKADVEKQMPMKYEHIVKCRLSKRQRQLYDGYMGLAGTRESFASGNYMSIINCLMQLRKVCNHPDLFETRQIVTSYALPKSVVADYEIKEFLVRRDLLQDHETGTQQLGLMNLWRQNTPTCYSYRGQSLAAIKPLMDATYQQSKYLPPVPTFDGRTMKSALNSLDFKLREIRLNELHGQYCETYTRSLRRPVYGSGILERLSIRSETFPLRKQPTKRSRMTGWYMNRSTLLQDMILSRQQRAQMMETTVQKFACATPAVVASDMTRFALTHRGVDIMQRAQASSSEDPFHEARVRLSIAFPDKSLIQYDCGKLQQLDRLLRNLQAGGHRALIFTQMTKVLDILEQFLNLHGHRYLRLDGATKIEQRQILTDRFNNDNRILAFILSSRSGGLGINLTGADTVIFYDLDWNPAMDKQCQDRCHRIGQTRDVHIYRFVSEGTIEANILRKSNQKRMLDDVVIQEGEFTTDYFNRIDYKDLLGEVHDGDAEADAALDKVLGNRDIETEKAIQQAEGKEDHAAAAQAQKEYIHTDDADFEDKPTGSAGLSTPKTGTPNTPVAGPSTPAAVEAPEYEADGAEQPSWEDYMLRYKRWEYRDTIVVPPSERKKKKDKKGKDKGIKVQKRH